VGVVPSTRSVDVVQAYSVNFLSGRVVRHCRLQSVPVFNFFFVPFLLPVLLVYTCVNQRATEGTGEIFQREEPKFELNLLIMMLRSVLYFGIRLNFIHALVSHMSWLSMLVCFTVVGV